MQIDRVGHIACRVGESPLWCMQRRVWYWVDISACRIWRFDPGTAVTRHWQTREMVGCIALDDAGKLVAGMESGIFRLVLRDSADWVDAALLASPSGSMAGMRFNDGRCDRQGRFWSGTMALSVRAGEAPGSLYRYSTGMGISSPIVSGLVVQNGLAWSPDGRTMYLSDSHVSRRVVWAFDYDPATGTPSGRRVYIDMNQHPGRPDGAAIDVDGCYWTCANDAGQVYRFTPAGKLDRSIKLPLSKPSMCSFGGNDLKTMLVTSISDNAPADDRLAGAVLTFVPGVAGMPEPVFAG